MSAEHCALQKKNEHANVGNKELFCGTLRFLGLYFFVPTIPTCILIILPLVSKEGNRIIEEACLWIRKLERFLYKDFGQAVMILKYSWKYEHPLMEQEQESVK